MELDYIFRVHIHEGTGFGQELQALLMHVVLGNDAPRATPYFVVKDKHNFDAQLKWSTNKQQWRRLASAGQFICKVLVYKRPANDASGSHLTKLGWVTLDLRQAKLNKAYEKASGEWHSIVGWKHSSDAPKLRISYQLEEATPTAAASTPVKTRPASRPANPSSNKSEQGPAATNAVATSAAVVATGYAQDAPVSPIPAAIEAMGSEISQAASSTATYSEDFDGPEFPNQSAVSGGAVVPAATAQQEPSPTLTQQTETGQDTPRLVAPMMHTSKDNAAISGTTSQPQASLSQLPRAAADEHAPGPHNQPQPPETQYSNAAGNTSSPAKGPQPQPRTQSPPLLRLEDGPFKSFTLTLDVRSFQASKALPLNLANIYLQAVWPQDMKDLFTQLGGVSFVPPLVSRPSVEVARGAEQPIPNCVATYSFVCGVLLLARLLAKEQRVYLEVWHKDKLRSDTLLGLASVPLSPLLNDCWVDGLAPVYARPSQSPAPGSPSGNALDKVQVGTLRVVLSLKDGPPPPDVEPAALAMTIPNTQVSMSPRPLPTSHSPSTQAQAARAPTNQSTHDSGSIPQPDSQMPLHVSTNNTTQTQHVGLVQNQQQHQQAHIAYRGGSQAQTQQAQQQQVTGVMAQQRPAGVELTSQVTAPSSSPPPPVATALASPLAAPMPQNAPTAPLTTTASQIVSTPEYEAALDLELWKKGEEARWRESLRAREVSRMALLEGQWRQRERERQLEVEAMRQQYSDLEAKTRQVLAALEDREKRLILSEEAAALRRRELDREHSAKMTEAEAAVRRLQVECEHQLEMERDRNVELARLKVASEERLIVAEERAVALEQAFAAYRDQVRNTSEASLQRELYEVKEQLKRANEKVNKLSKAKAAYKEQVVKLAEQVAVLHSQLSTMQARSQSDLDVLPISRPGPDQFRQRADHARDLSPLGVRSRNAHANHVHVGSAQQQLLRQDMIPTTAAAAVTATGALQRAADQQAKYAHSQQSQLAAMKQQLAALKHSVLNSPRQTSPLRGIDAGTSAQHVTANMDPSSYSPKPAINTVTTQAHSTQSPAGGPSTTQQQQHAGQQQGQEHDTQPGHIVTPRNEAGTETAGNTSQPKGDEGTSPKPAGSGRKRWDVQATLGRDADDGINSRDGTPTRLHGAADLPGSSTWVVPGGGGIPKQVYGDHVGENDYDYDDGEADRRNYHDSGQQYQGYQQEYQVSAEAEVNGATFMQNRELQHDAWRQPQPHDTEADITQIEVQPYQGNSFASHSQQQQQYEQYGHTHEALPPHQQQQLSEIQRLLRRKSELLATAAYAADDPLIRQIEARVVQLAGLP